MLPFFIDYVAEVFVLFVYIFREARSFLDL